MSQLPHLPLRKVVYEAPRKKRQGYFGPLKNFRDQAPELQRQVQNVLSEHKAKKFPTGVDPSLILKINLTNRIDENKWRKAGLTFLGSYKDKTLILFSSDAELIEFKKRLKEYYNGPKEGNKHARYERFFSSIDSITELEPNDRIGRHFQKDGIEDISDFVDINYTVDVELWHTGNKIQMDEKVEEIRKVITSYNGRICDKYVKGSIAILRVKCTNVALKILFSLPIVSSIDLPPRVSLKVILNNFKNSAFIK